MADLIERPVIVQAAGHPPKQIEEFFGLAASGTPEVSIARMLSPVGWSEPGQTAAFDEYTVVLEGRLHMELRDGTKVVEAGQAIQVAAGEWVRYSTPDAGGAVYISVCLPAFSPETVSRDPE